MLDTIGIASLLILAYITIVFLPSFFIGTTDGERCNRPDLSVHPYLIRANDCFGFLIGISALLAAGLMPFWVSFAGLIISAVCAYGSGYAATARLNASW